MVLRKTILSLVGLLAALSLFAQDAGSEQLQSVKKTAADSLRLEEVVVVGFSQSKKVNLTGAVQQVNMQEVVGDRPLISTAAALQGVIPGLTISGASSPGQPKEFNIRGTLSINGGSPLILIDNAEGDINALNPEDIESISVLKDAASAAIYGARAAGGVILITTKHPQKGDAFHLDYNFNVGFETRLTRPRAAALSDYIAAYKEAGYSSQYWAGNGDIDRWTDLLGQYRAGTLAGVLENGMYRDADGAVYYLKEGDVFGSALETGIMNNHTLSVSGSTDRIRYRLSGNYSHENGPMLTNKDAYTRIGLNAFVSGDVSKWFTQEATLYYTHQRRSDIMNVFCDVYSVRVHNWYPEGLMPGEFVGKSEDIILDSPANGCLYQPAATTQTSTPRIMLRSIFKPLKGWTITAEYTYQQEDQLFSAYTGQFTICDAQLGTRPLPATGKDEYQKNHITTQYHALNLFTNYDLHLNGHNLSVVAGYNQESNSMAYQFNSVKGQTVVGVPSLQGATGEKVMKDSLSEYAIISAFGRIAYNYMGRYLIEGNCRYDGSSKFPKENRFGFFPSVSGGWRISEEPFMEATRKYLDNLKIRASYGSIGNQNIAPYGFIAGMNITSSNVWLNKGEFVNVISTPGLIRANYTWETVRTFDIGADLNMFNNRLQFVFDWYNRTTVGMLGNGVELPSVVGAPAPLQNVSDMRTRGWELSLSWHDKVGDFSYRAAFNLYDHVSKITKFNNATGNLKYHYEGEVLGEIWGYVNDGFYSIEDFVIEDARQDKWILRDGVTSINGYSPKPGDLKFVDLDGDNEITPGENTVTKPGDRRVIGNSTPRLEYGLNLGVAWRGLDLSILLQGVGKRDYVLSNSAMFPFAGNTKEGAFLPVYANQTDYWTAKSYDPASPDYMVAANPDAYIYRIYGQMENVGSNTRVSDRYIQNASYMRLKNITLSYSLPAKLLAPTRVLSKVRFYLSGENLATICSLPEGYDPESLSWSYPYYRTLSLGANITF